MKRKLFSAFLWFLALGWTVFSLFLSWQPGAETGELSMRIVRFLLRLLSGVGVELDPFALNRKLRLAAHFGVFFIEGLLFSAALAVSSSADRQIRRWPFWAAGVLCSGEAVLAEVEKLRIPGRHLQWNEAMLNLVGVVAGVALVWAIVLIIRKRNQSLSKNQS